MTFDAKAFRSALGNFVTGVAVVTAAGPKDELIGMTVNSFNSVSLDPPLVLFSVSRGAHSLPAMKSAKGFAINLLTQSQSGLSDRFATPLRNKWEAVEYSRGHGEAPLITGALAQFECAPYAIYAGGDHVIFVGRVVRFAVNAPPDPLVFFRGRYTALDKAEAQEPLEPLWPLSLHY